MLLSAKWSNPNRGLLIPPKSIGLMTFKLNLMSSHMSNNANKRNRKPKSLQHWLNLLLCSTGLLLLPAAHAQRSVSYPATIESRSAGPQARIDVLGERFAPPAAVASSQSRIVLYRLDDARPGATSIFVNDRYHDSLVPGSWSQLCYASGPAELATRQMQAATRAAKDRYDAISALTLQGGQVIYLRVDLNNDQPVLRPVPVAQATSEIASTREQLHTVSRVAQDCMEVTAVVAAPAPAPAPVAPIPVQTYNLSADTLFGFNRSDRAAMTDSGTRAIDSLLARLAQDFNRIDRVNLIGHADPLGRPERNERLAVERAQTVREYLLMTRQLQAPITAEGRGSREPVVRSCGSAATAQAIACNQPNRRVAIEVTGLRR
jgi:OOP family OmpA-OmpF porin